MYYRFEQAHRSVGGEKLKTTVGDALLSYIEIYGYTAVQHMTSDEIKANLKKMWEDVALREQDNAIELKPDPTEEKKPTILSKLLPLGKSVAQGRLYL